MSILEGLKRHLSMTPFESFLPAPAPWSRAVTGMTALLARLRPRLRRTSGSERVGPYVLGEKLGEGGMGVVYKGRHARFGRPVAIKVLPQRRASSANVRRFEREAQLTQQLNHPNTIEVYDVGRTRDGLPYYAMEYVTCSREACFLLGRETWPTH